MSWPDQSPVKVARVTLSSAQVLQIFTTAVTIVPAPGAGLALVPLSGFLNYTFVSTPYTDGGGHLFLRWGQAGKGLTSGVTTNGFWTTSASQGIIASGIGSPVSAISTQVANLPIVLQQDTANPTLGNGTLTVTVAYMVVPVN